MKVHFIAIGGSAMHNLAIALHKKGIEVSGSDDEIFEPSKGRLAKYGLLPAAEGWDEKNINTGLDAVILGMHARLDNPELIKAQQLGIKIFSYPEYLYEQSKDKIRIVIGGSHGKTTITSMIIHVFNYLNMDCDYMVGAQLQGFEVMVKLTHEARYMIIEGDEYLTSPIDRRPKFHLYKPDIALISGIAWDHINVFPTFENYVEQFSIFADQISENGKLIYCTDDAEVVKVANQCRKDIHKFAYAVPAHSIKNGITYIIDKNKEIPLQIFGDHNLMNLNGARLVCNQAGITDEDFYTAIQSFTGASKRLELVKMNDLTAVYKDFAHSPSKLKATTSAVKAQFTDRKLIACMELHTFSSLTQEFLLHYKDCMKDADEAIVYFNPHTIAHKKLPPITVEEVKNAFNRDDLQVYTDSALLVKHLECIDWKNKNLLMMSSGNFDGIDFAELAEGLMR
ncbi:MAG: Mur ligase family protein [Bacteroidetes bacterium]|nr:Mur ligase family protein [Bacteroidota bacterium]